MENLRATKDNLVVRQLASSRVSSGGIELLGDPSEYTKVEVLSKGPRCYGDYEVGDILLCLGFRSGIELDRENSVYLVSEQIIHGVVEEE